MRATCTPLTPGGSRKSGRINHEMPRRARRAAPARGVGTLLTGPRLRCFRLTITISSTDWQHVPQHIMFCKGAVVAMARCNLPSGRERGRETRLQAARSARSCRPVFLTRTGYQMAGPARRILLFLPRPPLTARAACRIAVRGACAITFGRAVAMARGESLDRSKRCLWKQVRTQAGRDHCITPCCGDHRRAPRPPPFRTTLFSNTKTPPTRLGATCTRRAVARPKGPES